MNGSPLLRINRRHLRSGLLLLTAVTAMACGDESQPFLPSRDAGLDAGMRDTDAAVVIPDNDASSPPQAEAGALPEAGSILPDDSSSPFDPVILLSDTPDAALVHESVAELLYLRLLSSNLSSSLPGYWRWFGEIKNETAQAWCEPTVALSFRRQDGSVVWATEATVSAPLHERPEGETPLRCVAAGETVAAWAIEPRAGAPELGAIEVIRFETLGDSLAGTEPHRVTPLLISTSIDSDAQADGGTLHRVTGTLLGQEEAVSYVGVEIFVKDEQGLIFDALRAARIDVPDGRLDMGEAWSFATTTAAQPISSFRTSIEFVP
jgi:hypothetical protein